MTERVTIHDWCEFLRVRIAEEQRAVEGAGSAPDGTHTHPWELTEAGAPELGVRAGDDVLLTVRTGRGPWADLVVAEHVVRTQPRRAIADLDAWVELVDLLDHWANHERPAALELLGVVVQFAERYRDHPDHPDPRQR
ncbi:hypothetical protein AQJ46_51050 [Streptomyces canus]|uniref:Uncharacterized protein n=1 Tax=Streptomyces canus TaxID=58343 RepID=A0A101RJY7_9ACTN|nr:DUF6221 family protein [Streptomyces canus]KUN51715.1 hypothetical protein AQJ46_51050 [Streptomyces canus]